MRWRHQLADVWRTGLILCLAACVTAACGSGGGAALATPQFAGDYHMVIMFGGTSPTTVTTLTGTATPDGAGTLTFGGTVNEDGVIMTIPSAGDMPYTVDASGRITAGSVSDFMPLAGGITSDGACAVLANREDFGTPALMLLVREGGTFADADLDTDYHLGIFGLALTGPSFATLGGPVAFDGVGGWAGSLVINDEGMPSGPTALSGTYSVDGAGALVFSTSVPLEGGLLDGGSFGILGGATAGPDGDVVIGPVIRAGMGRSDATLSGTYWCAGIEYALAGEHLLGWQGTMTADGAGGGTLEGDVHDEALLSPFALTFDYAVAADGTLVVNRGPGEDLTGGVSADGRFAFVSGGRGAGSDPVLLVFCRK